MLKGIFFLSFASMKRKEISHSLVTVWYHTCVVPRDQQAWRGDFGAETWTWTFIVFLLLLMRSGNRRLRTRWEGWGSCWWNCWGGYGKGGFGVSKATPRCYVVWEEDAGRSWVMLRGGWSLGLPVRFLAIREVWLLESSGIEGRWTWIRLQKTQKRMTYF